MFELIRKRRCSQVRQSSGGKEMMPLVNLQQSLVVSCAVICPAISYNGHSIQGIHSGRRGCATLGALPRTPSVFFSRGRACAKLVTHVSVNQSEHHLKYLACKEQKMKNAIKVRKAFPKKMGFCQTSVKTCFGPLYCMSCYVSQNRSVLTTCPLSRISNEFPRLSATLRQTVSSSAGHNMPWTFNPLQNQDSKWY